MFKEMRRKDKELPGNRVKEVLEKTHYGVLGTITEDGYPYTTPINFVYFDNSIYFHSATAGEKLDNIQKNDKVSFNVVCDVELLPGKFDTNYKSVVAFGKAEEVYFDEKKMALLAFIEKYSKDFLEQGKIYVEKGSDAARVVKVNIEHMTGKFQE